MIITYALRKAMRAHRAARQECFTHQRDNAQGGDPMIRGRELDDAHMYHWYALQRAGVSPQRAGEICAAISRTRLPE